MKYLLALLVPLSFGQTPKTADWQVWRSLIDEAARLSSRGDFRAARPLVTRAVEEARLGGSGDGRLASSLHALGFIYCQTGEYRAAEEAYLEAIAISKRLPDSQPRLALTLDLLAFLYEETGRGAAEVEALRRQALDIGMASFGPESAEVGAMLSRLAVSLIQRQKYKEAEVHLRRALQMISEESYPGLAADAYSNLGAVAFRKKKYSEALAAFDRAGRLYQREYPGGGPAAHLITLGAVYLKLGRAQEADEALERAERLAVQSHGPNHLQVAEVLDYRAQSLRKLGKRVEADLARDRARAISAASRAEVSAVNSRVNAGLAYQP